MENTFEDYLESFKKQSGIINIFSMEKVKSNQAILLKDGSCELFKIEDNLECLFSKEGGSRIVKYKICGWLPCPKMCNFLELIDVYFDEEIYDTDFIEEVAAYIVFYESNENILVMKLSG